MVAQLAQRSLLAGGAVATIAPKVSDTPTIDGNLTALGGGVGDDDATAVSNGWMGSASSPSPCDVIVAAATASAAASVATGLSSGGVSNGGGMLAAASMPRPCSSLSLADLGDLCCDQEGDDGCGGVFLVGVDCEDVNGSGIGLDLYDLGQVSWFCVMHHT